MRLLLNEWYDFSEAGAYSVQLQPNASLRTISGLLVQQSTVRATLQVAQRNQENLKALCVELSKDALSADRIEKRHEAALALSHVRDPIAIPFLQQVLAEASGVRHLAVIGLTRIGGDEATEALLASLMLKPPEVYSLVLTALQSAENRTSNQELKARIKAALEESGRP
jgi:HEAT repeat protein